MNAKKPQQVPADTSWPIDRPTSPPPPRRQINSIPAVVSEISPDAIGLVAHVTQRMDPRGIENIRRSLEVFAAQIKEIHGVVLPIAVVGDGVRLIEIKEATHA